MKWFKHMVASHRDEKLMQLESKHGLEAYGFWFKLLEIVAAGIDEENKCELTYSLPVWSRLLNCHHHKVKSIFDTMNLLGLVTTEYLGGNEEVTAKYLRGNYRVIIPNLLKYRDNHSRNLQAKNKNIEEDKNIKPLPLKRASENFDFQGQEEPPKNSRSHKTNPRSLGTNPRAVAKAERTEKLDDQQIARNLKIRRDRFGHILDNQQEAWLVSFERQHGEVQING